MARGPDGRPLSPGGEAEEGTTHKVPKRSIKDRLVSPDPEGEAATRIAATAPLDGADDGTMGQSSGGGYIDDDPTEDDDSRPPPGTSDAEAKTKVYRPQKDQAAGKPEPGHETADEPAAATGDQTVPDPVVGWVVVIEGPGRGNGFSLGYGNNRVGRDANQRVCLDFGDGQISRENHCTITYDGMNRRFFIKEGDGRNLTYVGKDPVLVPVELKGGEELTMGATKLKFVPFCGKDFSWETT